MLTIKVSFKNKLQLAWAGAVAEQSSTGLLRERGRGFSILHGAGIFPLLYHIRGLPLNQVPSKDLSVKYA